MSSLTTYRRVEVNKDRAGNIFTAAGLGEESLVGTARANLVGDAGVVTAVGPETVLEQVPGNAVMVSRCERASMSNEGPTAPRRSYQAAYQPGRCGCDRSKQLTTC